MSTSASTKGGSGTVAATDGAHTTAWAANGAPGSSVNSRRTGSSGRAVVETTSPPCTTTAPFSAMKVSHPGNILCRVAS